MGLLKSLASLLETILGWFAPRNVSSAGALRASGSAIVHLADALGKNAEEWVIGPTSVSRRGVEVGWKGTLTGPRARMYLKMDGAKIHITPPEATVLKDSVRQLLASRLSK